MKKARTPRSPTRLIRISLASLAALALAAGVVVGREDNRPEPDTTPHPASAPAVAGKDAAQDRMLIAYIDENLARLHRPAREGVTRDLFALKAPPPPPPMPARPILARPADVELPALAPPPPPKPVAPPLPFSYLGRMNDQGKTILFLRGRDANLVAAAGDMIADSYRIADISDTAIEFVYLPLNEKQSLQIPDRK